MTTDDVRRREFQALKNVGPRIADDFIKLGVQGMTDLATRNPEELFEELCAITESRQDPCVLDTFRAAIDEAGGKPARPWWEYSHERKAGI